MYKHFHNFFLESILQKLIQTSSLHWCNQNEIFQNEVEYQHMSNEYSNMQLNSTAIPMATSKGWIEFGKRREKLS